MYNSILLLASWVALLGVSQAAPGSPCRAWIQTTARGNMLEISGKCSSLEGVAGRYRYEMSLERQGSGGHSTSQQSGEFELASGQLVILSNTHVNIDDQSTYIGHLRVFNARNILLAQDSVRHVPEDK